MTKRKKKKKRKSKTNWRSTCQNVLLSLSSSTKELSLVSFVVRRSVPTLWLLNCIISVYEYVFQIFQSNICSKNISKSWEHTFIRRVWTLISVITVVSQPFLIPEWHGVSDLMASWNRQVSNLFITWWEPHSCSKLS